MEIRNVLKFRTPLGFIVRMYVTERDIRNLIYCHILEPWNYKLVLYGHPLIIEFVYSITDADFSEYLASMHNFYSN